MRFLVCQEKGDSLSCVICLVRGIKSWQPPQWIIFQEPRFKIAITQQHSQGGAGQRFIFKLWKNGVEPREEMIVMDDTVRSSAGLFEDGWV